MATMFLKDTVICPDCGGEMFPSAFNKAERKISYRCEKVHCLAEIEFSFEDARLGEDQRYSYFCLNDDGDATWKCFTHAYCEYPIEALIEMDYSKFKTCCCILGMDEDELMDNLEFASGEGKDSIEKILAALDDDQISKLADDVLQDIELDMFDGDYTEAFVAQALCDENGVSSFIYYLIDRIYELFELCIDEDGNISFDE